MPHKILDKILVFCFRMSETAFITVCTQSQGNLVSHIALQCSSGRIIEELRVSLWRASPGETCRRYDRHNLSPYTCEILSNAVRQRCYQQHNCVYTFTYPDQNDCPEQDYLSDRPIVMRIHLECVRRKYLFSVSFK